MELLRMAIRNVTRNRRRSGLTIVSVVIGVTVLMNAQGVFRGLTATVYGRMMSMDTGQVQVEAAAYRAEARRLPLDLPIRGSEALAARLRKLPGVAAVSERIDISMELTNGVDGARTLARGVSPEEAEVTEVSKRILSGRFLKAGEPGILVGKGLADKLGLKAGDAAYYTALDLHSARNLGTAPVVGVFEFGYPLFDDYLVLMDIGQARAFLGMGGDESTRLVLRGSDPQASAALAKRVTAALAEPGGEGLSAYEWKTFSENLVSTVETRLALMSTVMSVLFALIAAGIFNTMAMNVQERYREIGTLRAIGIRRSTLRRLFLLEGLIVGAAGCLLAALPATLIGLFMANFGFDVSGIMPRDLPIPFGKALRASYVPKQALLAVGASLGAAVLGSIVPAFRASRLAITEAIGAAR
jgi:putative ABC transport system permease protein